MGATDAKVIEQRGRVGRMLGEADWPIARRAADLSPLVVPDHAIPFGQRRLRQ